MRSVWPASALVAMYSSEVAPAMSTQLSPFASQRRHWYSNATGSVPVQWPRSTVRVLPTRAVPLIVGGIVLSGWLPVGCEPAAAITADGPELAVTVPPGPDIVTTTRIVWPSSAPVATYMRPVSPATTSHASPFASQRCHWYDGVSGSVPLHTPGSTASVSPTCV